MLGKASAKKLRSTLVPKQNDPVFHHFNPRFMLDNWADEKREICWFSKPYDKIIGKMISTKSTGGEKHLYALKAVPVEEAQSLEKGPMQKIDARGAAALQMIENDDPRILRESGPRSDLSRFLMSMMMRKPKDIAAIKEMYSSDWERERAELITAWCAKNKTNDYSEVDAILPQPGSVEVEDMALQVGVKLMDHSAIGAVINNMRWIVTSIVSDGGEFLTSDSPLVMSDSLAEKEGFIFMPIGPKKLFFAVNNVETQERIMRRDPNELMTSINMLVAGRAEKWVYATNDAPLDFVRTHMGTRQQPSIFGRLKDFRKAKAA
jgi:hypothetical protein